MSDDMFISGAYYHQDEEEKAYHLINIQKFKINDLELMLKNPYAYHPKQIEYAQILYKILMDNYKGLYINQEKVGIQLSNAYYSIPKDLRWQNEQD